MTRKNIFEILKDRYNIPQEMNKLVGLFSIKSISYRGYNIHYRTAVQEISIEEFCDIEVLPEWKQRNSCLSCQEIKEKINFPNFFTIGTSVASIISCLEYYCNILYLVLIKFQIRSSKKYTLNSKVYEFILENIRIILDKLHYEEYINEKEEKVILIPKNPAATAVAEITKNKDIAFAILKYNHASLKGDLEGKKQLLISIATEYEPLLSKPIDGFSDYFDNATNMLNNLNIRHNNKEGKHKKDLLTNMSDVELEKWYDELYQLLLFCVLINDNVKRKKNIEEFLAQVNAKK